MAAQHFARRFKAADAWHLDVHEHDIGLELARLLQRFLTGIRLPHDLQTVYIGQHASDACPDKIMVIDN